jgi:signal transduction histidine kinase
VFATAQSIDQIVDQAFKYYIYEHDKFCGILDSTTNLSDYHNRGYYDRANILKSLCLSLDSHQDSIEMILKVSREVTVGRDVALLKIAMARVHDYKLEYDQSIQLYTEALDLLDKDLDRSLITLTTIGLGISHYSNFNHLKSISIFEQALKRSLEDNDLYGIVENLDWMASASARSGQLLKADSLWRQYQLFVDQLDNDELKFYALCNRGFSFGYQEKHDSAAYYMQLAFDFSIQVKDSSLQIEALLYLAEEQLALQNYNSALKQFEIYNAFDTRYQREHITLRLFYVAAESEAGLGNYKRAYSYYQKYKELDDKNWNLETKNKTIEFETKFQAAKKDAEIVSQKLQLTRSRSLRNWLFLGSGGLLLLTWFLIYRNRKNKIISATKISNLENHQKLMALDYMLQGQEEERKRIAQDLHDGLGGILTTVRHQIRSIQEQINSLTKMDVAGDAEKLISKACDEVRRISHDMMPASLVSLGLVDALEDMVQDILSIGDINIVFRTYGNLTDISDKLKVNIYRIIQEVINNILKHAKANNITMIVFEESGIIVINISDDGKGFDVSSIKNGNGLGLKGIRYRVNYMTGTMKVNSTPGEGTSYEFKIPLKEVN